MKIAVTVALLLGTVGLAAAQQPSATIEAKVAGAPARRGPLDVPLDGLGLGGSPAPRSAAPAPATVPSPTVPKAVSRPAPDTATAPSAPPSVTTLGGDGYVAENLRVPLDGSNVLVVPRLELRGTSLTREEVLRLLDPNDPTDALARLTAVNARELVVPALRIEGGDGAMDLRDLRLANVADGRIDAAAIGGGVMAPPGADRVSFDRFEADGLDLKRLLALSVPAPDAARPGLATVVERFALEGVAATKPGDHTLRIARLAGRDYRVRQTAAGWPGTFETAVDGMNDPAPGRVRQAAAAAADLLGAFELGSFEMTGFAVTQLGDKPVTVRLAGGSVAGGGRGGEIRFDGLDITTPDGTLRLASFVLGGVSLAGVAEGLQAVAASDSDEIGPAAARRLVPQIGTVRLGRLDADMPDAEGGPVKFGIESIELAAGAYRNGVPTTLRFAIGGVTVPVATAAAKDPSGQLGALGIDTIGLSFRTDLGWSESAQELSLRELSLALKDADKDLGTVTLRGSLGNVTKEVFDPDTAVAAIAALGIAVRALDLDLQDRGLTDRVLKATAAQRGAAVDDVRTEAAAWAVVGLPSVLANVAPAKTLAYAVGRFITKPGRLRVRVQPKAPAGLPIAEIAASQDPATLAAKLDLTATAE